MIRIKAFIKIVIFGVIRFFTIKSKNYVIFESANYFYDNSYSLYEYIKKHYDNYKIKYIVRNKEQRNISASYLLSKSEIIDYGNRLFIFKVYRFSLKAKVVFYSYYNYWNILKMPNSVPIVCLGHGEFPVKKVGSYFDALFSNDNNNFICFPATYGMEICKKTYPVLNNINCVITGTPRNDDLFNNSVSKQKLLETINYSGLAKPSIILFVPTFRQMYKSGVDFFMDEFPMAITNDMLIKLNAIAKKINVVLLFKTHHAQVYCLLPNNMSNIYFIDNEIMQKNHISLHSIYALSDVLITDYSAAYFSFLLLDRKVGFIISDKERYEKERGFTISEVEDIMPGDKITNFDELCYFIENSSLKDDVWQEQRNDVIDKFVGRYYSSNCEDVANKFLGEIKM